MKTNPEQFDQELRKLAATHSLRAKSASEIQDMAAALLVTTGTMVAAATAPLVLETDESYAMDIIERLVTELKQSIYKDLRDILNKFPKAAWRTTP